MPTIEHIGLQLQFILLHGQFKKNGFRDQFKKKLTDKLAFSGIHDT